MIALSVFISLSLQAQKISDIAAKEIRENIKIYHFLSEDNQIEKAGLQSAKIAVMYWNNAYYDSALYYFNEGVRIFSKLEMFDELRSIYTNMGAVYSEKGEARKAIESYKKSYEITQTYGNDREIAIKGVDLANAYSLNKQHQKSIQLIKEAIDYARKSEEHLLLLSCYSQMAKVYERKGDKWKAEEYKLRFNHYGDSVEGRIYSLKDILAQARKQFVDDSLANIRLAGKTKEASSTSGSELTEMTGKEFLESEMQSSLPLEEHQSYGIRYYAADSLGIGPVYRKVETMPEFLDGRIGLQVYLIKNIKISPSQFSGSKSKCSVEFIVNSDGNIIFPEIEEGISPETDERVLQAFQNMPDWIPGKTGNTKLHVYQKMSIKLPLEPLDQYLQNELNQLQQSRESILSGGNDQYVSGFYFQLAVVYFYLGEYDKASEYYKQALQVYEKMQDIDAITRINTLLAKLNEAKLASKKWFSDQMIMKIGIIGGSLLIIFIVVVFLVSRRRKT